ncbi:ImpA family type VI secretion system protein [Edaphobacter modestus]|uniref:Type VI secretion system protein ImpA n=1 Tax=Edaphobacter modestus TaxID=388466 RepID=A0A4V2G1L8_9BACT|nr:type VI secretion system ImpA family N-terminal domain-containing protein [Edaphobacter modestus]RZU29756.1 type VI secretion system protein ImpA [Edaphobacter modestus]
MTNLIYDRELLMRPITPDAPAGESLRYDPVYDRISTARRQEAALSQGVWQRATQQADWNLVEELCRSALATRSKDLQIAVWLAEAWLYLFGLPGFISGCSLIEDLHELYLVELIPSSESARQALEGGTPLPLDSADPAIEHRLNILQWMNDKFSIAIKLRPLTAPIEGAEVPAVSLADIETAQHSQRAARRQGTPHDVPSGDAHLARSIQLTPPEFIAQTWNELQHAIESIDQLGSALDRYYGPASSSLLRIRSVLHEMSVAIASAVPEIDPQPHEETITSLETGSDLLPAVHKPSASVNFDSGASIQTREEAYEALVQIANFLARLEPHSPVPYLLHRAIAWGGMSLKELLPELLHDQAALKDVGHLLRFEGADAHSIDK